MTPPRQLAFDLGHQPALARQDFVVSDSNRAAFDAACDPQLAPTGRLVLTGPAGAGKTHLAVIWTHAAEARLIDAEDLSDDAVQTLIDGAALAIDNIDRLIGHAAGEDLLFHALNLSRAHNARLFLTGRTAPSRWSVAKPDLASRLAALPHLAIGAPDDSLLSKIFDKLLLDRQISATPDTIRFLLPRMERSVSAVRRIVDALDRIALAEKRPITRAMARTVYETDPDVICGTGDV